jgi:2-haloacid dehalogenase
MAMTGQAAAEGGGGGLAGVRAVMFDTFGTTVDWLGGMTGHGCRIGAARGIDADWEGLAREWRSRLARMLAPVIEGKRGFASFFELHREELDEVVGKNGAEGLSASDRDELTEGWSALAPWPEAVEGLGLLKSRYVVGPLSNGSVRQLVDLAKFGGLPWDVVLGANLFQTYKPAAGFYLGAAELMELEPREILMVAAHNNDLQGAAGQGFRTCFVHRATEDEEPSGTYDLEVHGFLELAERLGARE